MVDVWFLFCIALTFIVITFHAIVDFVVNKEEKEDSRIRTAWVNPSVVRNQAAKTLITLKDQDKINKQVMTATKIVSLASFFIFNLGYWGYIVW